MNITPDRSGLINRIQETAFACQRCNMCCSECEPGSNLVLVSPEEVRRIMAGTGLLFDEVVEPYPDTIREEDREYTLGWAIRREKGKCRFLRDNACSVYEYRPWICRTYPFMLDEGNLIVSPCIGIGKASQDTGNQSEIILNDLMDRQIAEREEEKHIAEILPTICIPPGRLVVIDSEGMRIVNG